ncbi:MAG TPA: response regulator [Candidatus Saccharimonadales bacterium]|nr:response regulator [Candidatus Saccharimonadales bacterium]
MARILLIEPDYILAQTYYEALSQAGHEVIPTAGAQTALVVADDIQPDLIILELQLIEHSGVEFLYEFRSYPDWQHTPVILHTQVPPAEFNQNRQLLRTQLNVSQYLYKPQTTLQELAAAAEQCLAPAA